MKKTLIIISLILITISAICIFLIVKLNNKTIDQENSITISDEETTGFSVKDTYTHDDIEALQELTSHSKIDTDYINNFYIEHTNIALPNIDDPTTYVSLTDGIITDCICNQEDYGYSFTIQDTKEYPENEVLLSILPTLNQQYPDINTDDIDIDAEPIVTGEVVTYSLYIKKIDLHMWAKCCNGECLMVTPKDVQ